MLHSLRYWPCRSRIRRLRSGSEWGSASAAMWVARRSALTAITRTIRMLARPTVTTVRAGSRTGSLSARAPGTTAGDIHITDEATVEVLWDTALRDADLRDTVRWLGAASKAAVRARTRAADSMAADSTVGAANGT